MDDYEEDNGFEIEQRKIQHRCEYYIELTLV